MGTYVDVALHVEPAAFRARVPLSRDEDEEGDFWSLGNLPVELGQDFVRICTLNGAGWTVREILDEVRALVGAELLADPARVAISLECSVLEGPRTWAARLREVPHVTGEALDVGADDKVIDRTLGWKVPDERPISRASMEWLDRLERPEPEPDDEDLDAQAEAFLEGMDRDAILKALRAARGED